MKQLYILLTTFLFVFSNINAQTVSTVNSEGAWTAYMNWFENDNGSKGASVGGGTIVTGAGASDLQGFTITVVASEVNPPFFSTVPDISATTSITPA